MITLSIEKEVFQTILDALEIAAAWHKSDSKFRKAIRTLTEKSLS